MLEWIKKLLQRVGLWSAPTTATVVNSAPTVYELQPPMPVQLHPDGSSEVIVRPGPAVIGPRKWCVHAGDVGIVHRMNETQALFHIVGSNGETIDERIVNIIELRPARLGEIPESRRPDPVRGAVLGYFA